MTTAVGVGRLAGGERLGRLRGLVLELVELADLVGEHRAEARAAAGGCAGAGGARRAVDRADGPLGAAR